MILADKVDVLIKEAILHKGQDLEVLRAIKTKFIEYTSSKGAKPLDETTELQLLQKMAKERKQSADEYIAAGRDDLASVELFESAFIEAYLPKEPDKSTILCVLTAIAYAEDWLENSSIRIPKDKMGVAIKAVKEQLPLSNGKAVSDLVKEHLIS